MSSSISSCPGVHQREQLRFLQSHEGSEEAEGIRSRSCSGFREAKRVRERKHSSEEIREEKTAS